MIQHSLVMFQESLNSEYSQRKYTYLVKLFKNYYKIKDFDGIIKFEKKELQKMVETYVIHIKKTINPNTVPTYINPIKTFLETNDIDLNWRKIKRLFPAKVKRSGASAYQTADIQLMLNVTSQIRNKAIIHFLASTGVRIGAIHDLKIKHLRDMPHGCKMVLVYEDSTEEHITFLTPEASKALDLYIDERKKNGEIITQDSVLFRERYQIALSKPKALSTEALQAIIRRSKENASIKGSMKNGRYSEQLAHGFRKRFNTILKLNNQVNDNAIEKMMGHKNGLDGAYLQITPEQLFEEFKKGITDLTVSDEERDKIKIQDLEEEKIELKLKEKKIDEIQKQFEDFKKESQNEIEKLKYFNEVSSAYLQKGEFPTVEKRGNKRMFKYKSLDELNSKK